MLKWSLCGSILFKICSVRPRHNGVNKRISGCLNFMYFKKKLGHGGTFFNAGAAD